MQVQHMFSVFAGGGGGGGGKRTKVEMQILHLSKDAQDRAEKTLSELYGGQYKLRDARWVHSKQDVKLSENSSQNLNLIPYYQYYHIHLVTLL